MHYCQGMYMMQLNFINWVLNQLNQASSAPMQVCVVLTLIRICLVRADPTTVIMQIEEYSQGVVTRKMYTLLGRHRKTPPL